MNKLRSVNTRFWEDPFIESLNPIDKLLFLYLLTNPLANILGIYEISIKKMSYDTGVKKETISKALKGFERLCKVLYIDNYIILPNFSKNQKINNNMFKGAVNLFNLLPVSIKNVVSDKKLKGFESVLKASESFEKYESEIEVEDEIEIEDETEPIFDLLFELTDIFKTNINQSNLKALLKNYSISQLLIAGYNWQFIYFEKRSTRNEKERLYQYGKNKTNFIDHIDLWINYKTTKEKIESERESFKKENKTEPKQNHKTWDEADGFPVSKD